jgi:hypothetical protein
MAKGRRTTITEMQMNVLNGFDRTLRLNGQHTSGLLRNVPVSNWKEAPGLKKTERMSPLDKRIAALKAEIAALDAKEAASNRKSW